MSPKKILLATDFSDTSDGAKNFAFSIARDTGAEVVVCHVVEPPPNSVDRGFGGYEVEAEDEVDSQRKLDELVSSDSRVRCSHVLLHGAPAKEIVKLADSESADMIVIGSHGRRGLMHLLMGSVAEHVVRKASCPVVTIKQPIGEEQPT